MRLLAIFLTLLFTVPALAQLSVEQRAFDFQVLASLYAKRYAPASWKRETLKVDIFNIGPWLTRVRAAKDDVEYLELCKEYVASFDDAHTTFIAPGTLEADSGLFTDIYDGKVTVDAVNRTILPRARYAIDPGDEVISLDGKPVEQVLAEITKIEKAANPSTTRRAAADLLTFRPVSTLPRTALLGESLEIELKQADGETRKFTIPWVKTGYGVTKIGPVPSPRAEGEEEEAEDPKAVLLRAWNRNPRWTVAGSNWIARRFAHLEKSRDEVEGFALGWGSRAPTFTPPAGFVQRLGRSAADFHYSGTYMSAGKRIGYLRFPTFEPTNETAALRELAGEIAFFRLNTDGLVVDVQRNPGGTCYVLSAAAYLIPQRFWFFGEEYRPTLDLVGFYRDVLDLAKRLRVEQWLIDTIEFQLGMVKTAYEENRGVTGPIPGCSFTFENDPAKDQAGRTIAYEKPLIVLTDEFSSSAADVFPAMIQDNARGPLVGTRTTGAGGSVSAWDTGFYMEASATNTNSLITRRQMRAVEGYPTSYYIENVGVHPDIPLERMTLENLRTGGRPFTDGFTRIIVDEINKAGR